MSNANRTEAIQTAAAEIVASAEFMGGSERVAEIATFGHKGPVQLWPHGLVEADRFDLLCAVQDEAKSRCALDC